MLFLTNVSGVRNFGFLEKPNFSATCEDQQGDERKMPLPLTTTLQCWWRQWTVDTQGSLLTGGPRGPSTASSEETHSLPNYLRWHIVIDCLLSHPLETPWRFEFIKEKPLKWRLGRRSSDWAEWISRVTSDDWQLIGMCHAPSTVL